MIREPFEHCRYGFRDDVLVIMDDGPYVAADAIVPAYRLAVEDLNRIWRELQRAVRELNQRGPHANCKTSCQTCAVVRSFGFDKELVAD